MPNALDLEDYAVTLSQNGLMLILGRHNQTIKIYLESGIDGRCEYRCEITDDLTYYHTFTAESPMRCIHRAVTLFNGE